ncbi:VWA domain-containing protein [Solwaraspora sp. WMMD406]|uniref:vWA domain-containing protein n=1 Tax=Solwaraspora sp. WMMD406 TaxID=3016095 RepID=UPI002415A1D0|nr:vWA domain-containing protein [Solwaraspora sp. WMMD406]MDG4766873.1 VWA domain-containing protein [Solwaraspora sp. WMMD406]
MAAALLVLGLLGPVALVPGPAPGWARSDGEPRPVKVVVLVDQSGSLGPEGVAAEREAAAIITQSEFSPRSELAVVGFASDNGPGQSPVDIVCPMTQVDSEPQREFLTTCVEDLRIRKPDEGDDTDFVSALQQALSLLGDDPDDPRAKIVFLLTDGVLDVSDSDRYGAVEQDRNRVARAQLDEELARAREQRVQVWPLGFGDQVDEASLREFAAGGSQHRCSDSAPAPQARVVGDAADVVPSLLEAFASARCAAVTPDRPQSLPGGASREFTVDVPAIATTGSMTVVKRDPRIVVEYRDPSGRQVPTRGRLGDSTFQISGERGAVEVLRIDNPLPGPWLITVRSADGVPTQQISARVVWQGVVQAAVVLDPPQPVPGEPVTVSVAISTRRGAIDPASTSALSVAVRLGGEGFDELVTPLRDDGTAGDATAGDGRYTGTVRVPESADGRLAFVGTVSGEGIVTDERPANTRVSSAGPGVRTQIELPSGARVAPGGQLAGRLLIDNESGDAVELRLSLSDLDDGTLATLRPATVDVPAGTGRSDHPFVVEVAESSRRGPAQFVLRVVDVADDDLVYGNALVTVDVDDPPPPWWKWPLIVLAGLLAVALVGWSLLRRRAAVAARDVRGLVAELYRDGHQVNYLAAPDRRASEFRFVVRDEHSGAGRLDRAQPGEPAYVVRRRPDGSYAVRTPGGGEQVIGRAQRIALAEPGREVGLRDERADRRTRRPAGSPTGRSAGDPLADDDLIATPAAGRPSVSSERGDPGFGGSGPGSSATGSGGRTDDPLTW